MSQWVQSKYSKDAKKWEVCSEFDKYYNVKDGTQISPLMKFEYIPCDPPERWVYLSDYMSSKKDLLWYKQRCGELKFLAVLLFAACVFLAMMYAHEKSSHGPVAVPMGAGEKAELLKEVHAAKVAKDQAQADLKKARADYAASQAFFAGRAKELEGKITKDIQSLESPTARVAKLDEVSKSMDKALSTHQGVALEAKRVLGVANVQIVDR